MGFFPVGTPQYEALVTEFVACERSALRRAAEMAEAVANRTVETSNRIFLDTGEPLAGADKRVEALRCLAEDIRAEADRAERGE